MTPTFTRLLLLVYTLFLIPTCFAQTGIAVPQMAACDDLVEEFLETYEIPGATMALARNGELKYLRAFGNADIAGNEPTQPYHRFRIASVSKPITSIAIMYLMENGALEMSDIVFGEGGILENHPEISQAEITDDEIYDITVQNLLEHAAGWDRNTVCTPNPTVPYPFQFGHCDPIGFPLHVTSVNGTTNPVTEEDLIVFLLEKGLDFSPNTAYSYSNIGYLVLGEIIEELSGMSYESYIQTTILEPLGIYDMSIANNLLEDKQEREGEYIGNGYTILSCYGTGNNVPWEYGGWSIEAMDAHGGWISSARDLVKLLVAVDGFDTKPDILEASTINTMVAPSVNYEYYAKGWAVNSFDNWWHTGALDGTATLYVRTSGGFTWAILLNKRVIDGSSGNFWMDFDNLPWSCITGVSSYPNHDLMDQPLENSSGVQLLSNASSEVTISWTPGDGQKRIAVVSQSETFSAFPLDGLSYDASEVYGQGDDLGNNTYVVYNGSENETTISGFDPGITYYFRVYDYNQSASTGNYPLYLLGDSETFEFTTLSTGIGSASNDPGFELYPTLSTGTLTVRHSSPSQDLQYRIVNLSGVDVKQGHLEASETLLEVHDLKPGFYTMIVRDKGVVAHLKFIRAN